MKKQKNHINILFKRICLSGLFSLSMLTGLSAQDYMDNGRFIADGNRYTVPAGDQKIRDIVVPPLTSGKFLYLELKGADGGRLRQQTAGKWAKGGEGATVIVYAKIGNAAGQIPEGTHFRFIVGEKGSDKATSGTSIHAAGSGGGTGVAFRGPKAGDPWQLLAVAGAGSGALGDCCTFNYHGDPGQGIVATKITSSNGTGGSVEVVVVKPADSQAGAGGGAFSDGESSYFLDEDGNPDHTIGGGKAGWPGGPDSGVPTGGAGGVNSGWGFGGGGGSPSDDTGISGGGGGFAGGDVPNRDIFTYGGDIIGYSHGGGSFYNQAYVSWLYGTAIVNSTTEHPDDGHVDYQFLDVLPDRTIKLTSAPQKCIDVKKQDGILNQNGNNVRLWDCSLLAVSQNWQFDGSKINLTYNSRKCLDVENHQTANGTNVRIWDCMDHNEQKWIYDGITKQFRSFLDLNKCLNDAYGGRTDNGTNVMLWDCNNGGGKADQWNLKGAVTVSNPTEVKNIVPIKDASLALQSTLGAKWGSNVQLGTKNTNDSSERWVFDGKQIKYSPSRDLCITLADGNTGNGTNIELRGCSDSAAKKWIYDGLTRTIRLAANPNKCVEVATTGGVFEKGMNIQIMDCNGLMRQKFDIK